MSGKSSHLAQLLAIQRERDALREANCKLRDKLLELAKECSSCGGTGCVTVVVTTVWDTDDEPRTRVEDCGDCVDIREVLR